MPASYILYNFGKSNRGEGFGMEYFELTMPTEQEFYKDVRLILKQAREQAFTMANVIVALNKPTIIVAHNKTLATQLYGELKN